jgi:hypothetical protein
MARTNGMTQFELVTGQLKTGEIVSPESTGIKPASLSAVVSAIRKTEQMNVKQLGHFRYQRVTGEESPGSNGSSAPKMRKPPRRPPASTKTSRKGRKVTDEHKAAMALGRDQGRVIGDYLRALETKHPGRGYRRSPEKLAARLAVIEEMIPSAESTKRLALLQERISLRSTLAEVQVSDDLSALEERFIATAKDFSERKGITYAAWRDFGVKPEVLKRAGITRS